MYKLICALLIGILVTQPVINAITTNETENTSNELLNLDIIEYINHMETTYNNTNDTKNSTNDTKYGVELTCKN